MIESIITDYLRQNRRLVIPELGAFLKKEGGETVFVPFLHKDDGILNGLVRRTYGASPAEAEGIIAKYVENIRTGIESRGAYLVSPLGSLKNDPNGLLFLDTEDLNPQPTVRETVIEAIVPVEQETPVAPPEPAVSPEPVMMPEPEIRPAREIREPAFVPEAREAVLPFSAPAEEPPVAGAERPEEPRIVAETVDAPKTLNDLIREKQEEKQPTPTIHERMSEPVAPSQPIRKPAKPTTNTPRRKPSPASAQKGKRGDVILIAAVIVAVIAVIAMIYAYAVVDLPLFNLQ